MLCAEKGDKGKTYIFELDWNWIFEYNYHYNNRHNKDYRFETKIQLPACLTAW